MHHWTPIPWSLVFISILIFFPLSPTFFSPTFAVRSSLFLLGTFFFFFCVFVPSSSLFLPSSFFVRTLLIPFLIASLPFSLPFFLYPPLSLSLSHSLSLTHTHTHTLSTPLHTCSFQHPLLCPSFAPSSFSFTVPVFTERLLFFRPLPEHHRSTYQLYSTSFTIATRKPSLFVHKQTQNSTTIRKLSTLDGNSPCSSIAINSPSRDLFKNVDYFPPTEPFFFLFLYYVGKDHPFVRPSSPFVLFGILSSATATAIQQLFSPFSRLVNSATHVDILVVVRQDDASRLSNTRYPFSGADRPDL